MPAKRKKNLEKEQSHEIRAARSGILYIAGQVAASVSVLVLLIILARLLKPSNFGLYAIVIAFYTLLGIAGNFGLGAALRKRIPEAKSKDEVSRLITNTYALGLAIAVMIAIAGLLSSGWIAANVYHEPMISNALQLASVIVVFWVMFNITIAALVGLDKIRDATIMDLFYSLLQPISATALVLMGFGVLGAVAGIAISIALGCALGLYYLSKEIKLKIEKPSREIAGSVMRFSTPIGASNLAVLGPQNFAILLLGAYATSAIVGNYNAAYEIGNFVGVIFTSSAFVLLPIFAGILAKEGTKSKISKMYNGSIYYTLLILLPVLAFAIGAARPLMYLLFSRLYALTPFYFAAIAAGTALGIFGVYAGTLIISYGDVKKFMVYQLAVVAIELLLLFALTPYLKGIGVLLSLFLVGPIVLDLVYVNALSKQFRLRQETRKIALLAIAAIITFLIVYGASALLNHGMIALPVGFVLTVLVFPPFAALLGGVAKNEMKFMKELAGTYSMGFIANYILDYTQIFIR